MAKKKKKGAWKVTESKFVLACGSVGKIVELKVGDQISMKIHGGFCGPFTVMKVSPHGQRCDAECSLCGVVYTHIDTRLVTKTDGQNLYHRDEGNVITSAVTYEIGSHKKTRRK